MIKKRSKKVKNKKKIAKEVASLIFYEDTSFL